MRGGQTIAGCASILVHVGKAHETARKEWRSMQIFCEATRYDPMRFVDCEAAHDDPGYPEPYDAEIIMHSLGVLEGTARLLGVEAADLLREAGCIDPEEE